MPLPSAWPSEAAKASGSSQHESQASLRPRAAAWTTDTNMSFRDITNVVALRGGPIQKENLSLSGASIIAKVSVIQQPGGKFRGYV